MGKGPLDERSMRTRRKLAGVSSPAALDKETTSDPRKTLNWQYQNNTQAYMRERNHTKQRPKRVWCLAGGNICRDGKMGDDKFKGTEAFLHGNHTIEQLQRNSADLNSLLAAPDEL